MLDPYAEELQAVVVKWLARIGKVTPAKITGEKARRDTRFWNPPGPRPYLDTETKALPPSLFNAAKWAAELAADTNPVLSKMLDDLTQQYFDAVVGDDGVNVSASMVLGPKNPRFNAARKAIADALKAHQQSIAGFTKTVADRIRKEIADGDAKGLTIKQISQSVADLVGEQGGYWAERVARTEITGAANEASLIAVEAVPAVKRKQWLTAHDDRVRESHRDMDEEVVDLDEPFSNGLMFPGDQEGDAAEAINCFPASTLVDSVGAITGGVRRRYDGPIVELRFASGNVLSVTPNHPLLTTKGWQAANALAKGDHLLRADVRERVSLGDPDVDHGPAMIGQVVDSLARRGVVARVLGSDVDLHGEVPNGEVEVVRSGSKLRNPRQAGTFELVAEPEFATADLGLRSFASHGFASELDLAGRHRSPREVGGESGSLTFGLGHPGGPEYVLFADAAGLDSCLSESTNNDLPADAVSLAQARLGFAALVEADELVDVDVVAFHGDVLTLETSLGWYTANSVLARNCRCTMIYVFGDAEVDPAASGNKSAQFKYSEDQPRDDHGRFGSGGGGNAAGSMSEYDLLVEGATEGTTDTPEMQAAATQLAASMKAEGDKILARVNATDAAQAKRGVAHKLAARMKAPVDKMLAAMPDAPQREILANYTDPEIAFTREPGGYVTIMSPSPGYPMEKLREGAEAQGKDFVEGGTPEAEEFVRESVASTLVGNWASTSNDSNPASLAIQLAAEAEFDLSDTADWHDETGGRAYDAYEKHGDVYREFVRAQYDDTQARFKELGVTSVTLQRGFSFEGDDSPKWASDIAASAEPGQWAEAAEIRLRPMSSWTSDPETTEAFATQSAGEDRAFGIVLTGKFKVDQILSFPETGNGCLAESEFVVLGGSHGMNYGFNGIGRAVVPGDPDDINYDSYDEGD